MAYEIREGNHTGFRLFITATSTHVINLQPSMVKFVDIVAYNTLCALHGFEDCTNHEARQRKVDLNDNVYASDENILVSVGKTNSDESEETRDLRYQEPDFPALEMFYAPTPPLYNLSHGELEPALTTNPYFKRPVIFRSPKPLWNFIKRIFSPPPEMITRNKSMDANWELDLTISSSRLSSPQLMDNSFSTQPAPL